MKSLIVGDKVTVQRLAERLKRSESRSEYQRIQCVLIRVTLGSSAAEIAQLLGWSVASVLRHLMGLPQATIEDRAPSSRRCPTSKRGSTSQTRCTTPATRAVKTSRPSTTASSRGAPESSDRRQS